METNRLKGFARLSLARPKIQSAPTDDFELVTDSDEGLDGYSFVPSNLKFAEDLSKHNHAAWPSRFSDDLQSVLRDLGYEFNSRGIAKAVQACGFTLDQYANLSGSAVLGLLRARETALSEINFLEAKASADLRKQTRISGGRSKERRNVNGQMVTELCEHYRRASGSGGRKAFATHLRLAKGTLETAEGGLATDKTLKKLAKYAVDKARKKWTVEDFKKLAQLT